ncbi:MAG: ISAs1 family transposase [Chlamydiales bacterium]|nr:ISAs1 family transposase [Chlamydiales bacterium]
MAKNDKSAQALENQISTELIKDTVNQYFGSLRDPRLTNRTTYSLVDILFVTICAVLCGAEDLEDVATYAQEKREWLQSFLNVSDQIPCYSTFWWTFVLLKPEDLERCFVDWVQALITVQTGETIAIDGKALRGTNDPKRSGSFVHMVSAWGANSNFTLAQVKVDTKSNEITAIPKLLDMMNIEGAVVTIDAMGCQTAITEKIVDSGADYILGLKENQPHLYDEVVNYFSQVVDDELEEAECQLFVSENASEKEKHGRIEVRKIYTTGAIDFLPQKGNFKKLQSIVCVCSKRTVGDKTSEEKRYYISSLPSNPERQGDAIRSHWGIENKVHWVLDVAFNEDKLKAKTGYIAENLAVIRHIVVNLLKNDRKTKGSIAKKRFKAALNEGYFMEVLKGFFTLGQ